MMVVIILILSVFLGALLGHLFSQNQRIGKLLLTFSGAFLLTITFLEIIPHIYASQATHSPIGLFILAGVLVQIILESITRGAEHGHFHFHGEKEFPLAIFIGLSMHAFFEGAPLSSQDNSHLIWAVAVHKIPVAMVLYVFLSRITTTLWKRLFFVLLFALASPTGYWIGASWLQDYMPQILAFVAGIFLHISTTILFESDEGHRLKIQKLVIILLGFIIAYGTLHLH